MSGDEPENPITGSVLERCTSTENSQIYICEAFFEDFYSNTNGGAISLTSTTEDTQILIESSSFYNTSASQSGGAIYMERDGKFLMNKCCGNSCFSTSESHFFSNAEGEIMNIAVTRNSEHINSILYSSFYLKKNNE